jgi:hypothetical protein
LDTSVCSPPCRTLTRGQRGVLCLRLRHFAPTTQRGEMEQAAGSSKAADAGITPEVKELCDRIRKVKDPKKQGDTQVRLEHYQEEWRKNFTDQDLRKMKAAILYVYLELDKLDAEALENLSDADAKDNKIRLMLQFINNTDPDGVKVRQPLPLPPLPSLSPHLPFAYTARCASEG